MSSIDPKRFQPSRRSFLASSALLAGCSTFGTKQQGAPIPIAKARTPLGEGEPIRMGVIGTGGMGGGHMNSILSYKEKELENVEVVAVSDVCKPRLDGAVARCNEKQDFEVDSYGDYTELLERDDIHAVLIASPEHWHGKMAEDAIAQGKDVYLEKPMTLRLPEALRLREVVNANEDMRVQVGTQYMMVPKYIEAQKLIAEGAIGHPTLSQTSYCRNSLKGEWLYGIDESVQPGETLDWEAWLGPLGEHEWDTNVYHRWRRYRDFSTGIIGDLLVHQMTPLMMALDVGWPVRVTASGGHYIDKAMENHDQVFLTVEFEKEHTMIVGGSTCNELGLETLIRGHEANMYLGGNNVTIRPERIFVDDIDERTVECPTPEPNNPQDRLRLNWFQCVRTREPVRSPVEFGAQVMVIVDLATRSMWEGGAYTFDPATLTAKHV